MRPLFSIIVPTHNRYALLQECIASVLRQTCNDWQLIIVDDGSTDDTAKMEFSDERISIIHQKKSERSEARNLGIENAKGRFLLFIDDDDYILDNHLTIFKEAIEKGGDELIYRTGFIRKDMERDSTVAGTNYSVTKHENPVNFAAFQMCGVWSLCIPKACLEEERFPIGFPHWQDTHLILRLFSRYPLSQLPTHSYIYRIHADMGSRKRKTGPALRQQAKINVAAIEHFFNNYSHLTQAYLPRHARSFLCDEKWLEYAVKAETHNDYESARIFKKEVSRFRASLWKYYILYYWNMLKSE